MSKVVPVELKKTPLFCNNDLTIEMSRLVDCSANRIQVAGHSTTDRGRQEPKESFSKLWYFLNREEVDIDTQVRLQLYPFKFVQGQSKV